MTAEDFPASVREIVEPLLVDLGFTLDTVNNDIDEGGRRGSVVYYRSGDCKMQIYRSAREGSINCMIAPLSAPNAFGPLDRTGQWQYLTRFATGPRVPLEQLLKDVPIEPLTTLEQLGWVGGRISQYYAVAHSGILEMFGNR